MTERATTNRPYLENWAKDLWSTLWETLAEFVWNDVRDGMINLRGFSPPLRVSVWLGFFITALCLLLLTQSSTLRANFPLATSTTSESARGIHIPLPLFPLSTFLLSAAWAYLLAGARYSHWLMRAGAFLLYSLTCAIWVTSLLATNPGIVAAGAAIYSLTLLAYALPDFRQPRPALQFALTLMLVGTFFALVQFPLVRQDQASGLPVGRTALEGNIRSLATVVIPLLILIGLDIADFTVRASVWVSEAANRSLPRILHGMIVVALLLFLVVESGGALVQTVADSRTLTVLLPLLGTLLLVLILWLAWRTVQRQSQRRDLVSLDQLALSAGTVASPLVFVFLLPLLASFLWLEMAQVFQTLAIELSSGFYGDYRGFVAWAASFYRTATAFSSSSYLWQAQWQLGTALLAILAAFALARRGQAAAALFAVTVGVHYLWLDITRAGHVLHLLGWTTLDPLIVAWLGFVVVRFVMLLRQRAHLDDLLPRLLLLLSMLALMRLPDLIAAPLDPLFSLTGVGYLAVGLGWDLVTAGKWANHQSRALPRISRIFLYLGYVILTGMLVNWAAAAHDLRMLEGFTGQAALTGLSLLGYPYLFATINLLMAGAPLSAPEPQSTT